MGIERGKGEVGSVTGCVRLADVCFVMCCSCVIGMNWFCLVLNVFYVYIFEIL